MVGKFVDYKGYRIWVWREDVEGILVNGRPTSYEEQAMIKFKSGFINTMNKV